MNRKEPELTCFKPDGLTKAFLRKNGLFNEMEVDEFEAFRLAHLEGLSMAEGAGNLNNLHQERNNYAKGCLSGDYYRKRTMCTSKLFLIFY